MITHTVARNFFAGAAAAASLSFALPARADISGPLAAAFRATTQSSSYHFTLTEAGKTFDGDFEKPERYRTSFMGMDMIMIGNDSYVRRGASPWRKMPGLGAGFTSGIMKKFEDNRKTMTSADLGMRTVDGQSMHAYKVDDARHRYGSIVYVNGSGRIGRFEMKHAVVTYSSYDRPIDIKAPL